jgi:ubiquinone/menaquinone biosynthesis C-methylase UbiE
MWKWEPESFGVALNYWRLHILRNLISSDLSKVYKILDLGSAESIFTWDLILMDNLIKWKGIIIACELSIVSITHGKEINKNYVKSGIINYINCSIEYLPLKIRNFSILFAGNVLNHLKFPQLQLENWKKYMNNKSILIIDLGNERFRSLKRIISKYFFKRSLDQLHFQFYTERSLKKQLKNYFSSVKIIGLGKLFGFPMMFVDKFIENKNFLMHFTAKSNKIFCADIVAINKL